PICRYGVASTYYDNMWKLLPEVIFCTVAIFSGLIAWLLPETNNARLPETIEDIEEMRYKKKKREKFLFGNISLQS
uniref:Uncharacterized protein n=1 Tax=Cyprinus carpio TaxID=7962 RepID=A0A8C1GB24_CYPCA